MFLELVVPAGERLGISLSWRGPEQRGSGTGQPGSPGEAGEGGCPVQVMTEPTEEAEATKVKWVRQVIREEDSRPREEPVQRP